MDDIDFWAIIVKARVFRKGHIRKSRVFSSICMGCKEAYVDLMEHSMWEIGKGDKINLWCDNLWGMIIASLLHVPADRMSLLKAGLCFILHGNSIVFPNALITLCLDLPQLVSNIHVNCLNKDKLVWMRAKSGENIVLKMVTIII